MIALTVTSAVRDCGGCTVCCTVPEIYGLGKPAHTTCCHVDRNGCAIYLDRPHFCRDWSCMWLRGQLDDTARPDRLGLMFD
jgi:hypothetical protein